jgi:hypothetical protein
MASGESALDALTGGYHLAFLVGAIFAVGAATIGAAFLREAPVAAHGGPPPETPAEELAGVQ